MTSKQTKTVALNPAKNRSATVRKADGNAVIGKHTTDDLNALMRHMQGRHTAEGWTIYNGDAWSYIRSEAKRIADEGRPVSVRDIMGDAKGKDFLNEDGGYTVYPHIPLNAHLARILCVQDPSLTGHVTFRHGGIDSAYPELFGKTKRVEA